MPRIFAAWVLLAKAIASIVHDQVALDVGNGAADKARVTCFVVKGRAPPPRGFRKIKAIAVRG